ncbi:MAG TPA: cobalamin-binding protein [Thermodesulfobacteriota bacterium]|nr:cobalamin-binding protein [Thermodesulfobacteriota bacterium]
MKRVFLLYLFVIVSIPLNVSHSKQFPQRIISLSPSITEIIYGIGALKNVVGVTLYTDFPPEAKKIPQVGGWVNPNLEAILKLQPDLVIMIEDQNQIFGDKIRRLGLKTLAVDSNKSISDVLDSITDIGKALGKEEKARKLRESVKSDIEEIQVKTKDIHPKRVLFVVGRNPGTLEDIYAIGNMSFINEIITVAGGQNVIEIERLAVKISREAILSLNPDVIVEVNHDTTDKKAEVLQVWNGLKEVSAVKNGEVYVVPSKALVHPSQRILEAAGILAEILHPEVFKSNHSTMN